jgi:inorganic triphosphatase YgiF
MEIELKLALPPRQAAHIRRHALLQASKPVKRTLHSIYFDTPEFDLMRRGIALRVRRIGFHWVQTLKAEARAVGAMSSRPEWEMAVAGGASPDFAVLPKAALELLKGLDLTRIGPAFVTEFQRTAWQLVDGENQAELALDIGKIQAGEASQPISEVEIELKAGTPGFLFDLAVQLLGAASLQIEPRSKAERGYALCGATTPVPLKSVQPHIHPKQTAEQVWHALMQAALMQLVANVPGFLERAQDIEYLHQLRIALRRLRTGVALAKGSPSKGSPSGQLAPPDSSALRATMRELNPARDWDVFLRETLPKTLAALGEAPAAHDVQITPDDVFALFHEYAAEERQRAQAWIRSPEFTRLVLDLGRSLLPPDETTNHGGAKETHARNWAAGILEKRWLTLRKRCRRFARLTPEERHMARIAAKKLRYAADAFAPLFGKRGARFVAALADLQSALGRANDAQVGIRLLNTLPKKNIALSFDLGRIDGALQVEAARHGTISAAIWLRLTQSRLFWRE